MGWPICNKGNVTDFNSSNQLGYYDIRGNVLNAPKPSFYGLLLVVRSGSEVLQLVSTSSNELFSRTSTNGGTSWTDWATIR